MRKLFAFFTIAGMLTVGSINITMAQNAATTAKTEKTETVANADQAPAAAEATVAKAETAPAATTAPAEAPAEEQTFHQVMKQKFIEGGVVWMAPILILLIFGLALVIERIIYLNLATTNTKKLLGDIENALANGGVEKAKELCRNTRGPVASIFYQGLDRADESVDLAEKAVVSYGGVQMGRMETGLSWISLFIALAPMLGFLGTVVGMIIAFDDIAKAGDMSPALVAGGIKVALLTTVFGLIVAMILQVFYNYLVAKIEGLVNSMEDASISLIDIIYKHYKK